VGKPGYQTAEIVKFSVGMGNAGLARATKHTLRVSARPAYKGVSRPVFRYVGIAGILDEECRRMYRYAGLI
jgi:hypothetical protein